MQLLLKPPPQCRLLHLLIFLVLSFFFHTTTTSNKRKAAATVAATSRKAGGILTSERGEVMPRVLPFVTILVLLFLLLSSAATDPHPATVPASPEWSSAACPLDIPDDLLHDIATACSPVDSGSDTRSQSATLSRCCPSLAASLHAAHAAAALAVLSPVSNNGSAVPDPPDDSEGCASAAEVALRARGVLLPRPNETCDLTYCYCGVRLRRLHCPGPFVASAAGGRWVPANEDTATLIQTECRLPELDGCTRCLHSLYQLRSEEAEGVTSDVTAMDRQRECQLMGLTWLLDENRAHYLHVAALVLRAFMASPTGVDPTSCSVPGGTADDIPLLVDSGWVGAGSSSTFHSFFLCALSLFLLTINH